MTSMCERCGKIEDCTCTEVEMQEFNEQKERAEIIAVRPLAFTPKHVIKEMRDTYAQLLDKGDADPNTQGMGGIENVRQRLSVLDAELNHRAKG